MGYRLLAFLVDVFIVFFIGIILNRLFGFGTYINTGTSFSFNMNFYEATFLFTVYFGLFEYFLYGQTPAKKLFKVKVKQTNMEDFDDRNKYLYRGLLKGLLILISIISFIVALVNNDKQSIHDLIMKTIVVRKIKAEEIIE